MNTFSWDFTPITEKQWKQQVQFELQGKDYQNTMLYKSDAGIHIKPIYTQKDRLSSCFTQEKCFAISHSIKYTNTTETIAYIKNAIANKAAVLHVHITDTTKDIQTILATIPNTIFLELTCSFLDLEYIKNLGTFIQKKGYKAILHMDPIAQLGHTGNWFYNLKKDLKIVQNIHQECTGFLSCLSVNATTYQNAGATITQELAYTLSHAHQYMGWLKQNNLLSQYQNKNSWMHFNIAIGSTEVFVEAAKIKALRLLWKTLAQSYQMPSHCSVHAKVSKRDKTIYASANNTIRITIAQSAAWMGGADTIETQHAHIAFQKATLASDTQALKALCYIQEHNSKTIQNSYAVDKIAESLAEKALVLFKSIEKQGGFLQALKQGKIQKEIQKSHKKQEQAVLDLARPIIGVTTQTHPKTLSHNITKYPFLKRQPRKTLVIPILEKRLASIVEKKYLPLEKKQNHG